MKQTERTPQDLETEFKDSTFTYLPNKARPKENQRSMVELLLVDSRVSIKASILFLVSTSE